VPLKQYQERVLREVKHFLELLAAEQCRGNRHATLDAWRDAQKALGGIIGNCQERENGLGKDLPTVCVKVPTGGGKSLCYQLPGIAADALAVVVSPLIALMADQYRRLVLGGHPAAMIASGMDSNAAVGALAGLISLVMILMLGHSRVLFALRRAHLLPPAPGPVHPARARGSGRPQIT